MRGRSIPIVSLFLVSVLLFSGNYGGVSATLTSSKFAMTFYFHYANSPVFVGGTMSHYLMNTTTLFQPRNNSVLKPVGQPKIEVDFYMYPDLAGPATFNGTWQIIVWANASALKPTVWNMEFWEVTSGGSIVWDSTSLTPSVIGGPATNNGYLDVPIYAYNLSTVTPLAHTFSPGDTVRAAVMVNPGSTVSTQIWYDSSSFPSQAIFPSQDHIAVASVNTYLANNTKTSTFAPNYALRLVRVRSNVTDPFGGYDVVRANITVLDPSGSVVVSNAKMPKTTGGYATFSTLFEYNYTYPANAPSGQYNITITAADNNHHMVAGYGFFVIGLEQLYEFYAIDSKGAFLPDAQIMIAQSASQISGQTNSSGYWGPIALATGSFNVSVVWESVVVNSTSNFFVPYTNSTTLIILKCRVYNAVFTAVDSKGFPLPSTPVRVTFANSSNTILPIYTSASGSLYFNRIPVGTYFFQVYWQGILVNSSSVYVGSNSQFILNGQVYYASFKVVDDSGIPLKGAFIIVAQPNVTSSLLTTSSSGNFDLNRIPVGNYEIKVLWQSVTVKTLALNVNSNLNMVLRAAVYHMKIDVVDSKGYPLPSALVIMTPPNPSILPQLTLETNSSGFLSLDQIPGGLYSFRVVWQGVPVGSTQANVTSSGSLTITSQVYYYAIKVVDNGGSSLSNALVIVYSSPSGTPYTVVETNASGMAMLSQIPMGSYLLKVDYSTTYMLTLVHASTSQQVTINSNSETTLQLSSVPPPFYTTLPFLVLTPIALLLIIIYAVYRMRGTPKRSQAKPQLK